MKKFLVLFSVLFILFGNISVNAKVTTDSLGYKILAQHDSSRSQKFPISSYLVIDGSSAVFTLAESPDSQFYAKFLLIEAPELDGSTHGQEAKNRVEQLFKQADRIELEFENRGTTENDYELVYVWVDNILLQEILATEGHAIAKNIEKYSPNSSYKQAIYDSQDYAMRNSLRVWNGGNWNNTSQAEFPAGQSNWASNTQQLSSTPAAEPVQNVYYKNCSAVRAAGAAPIYRGEPGYASHLDRDKDGIGCE